jgi:flagellar biosynthesis/type III secretory pathway protein FliH
MLDKIYAGNSNKQILTQSDVLLLSDLTEYKKNVERQCADMIAAAKEEASLLRQKLEADAKIELENASLALRQNNQTKISELLDMLNNSLAQILQKLLAKFKIDSVDPKRLESMIRQDIAEILRLEHFKFIANKYTVDKIQTNFSQSLHDKIEYIIDDSLSDGMCQLESADSIIKFDFEHCSQEINQILNNIFTVDGNNSIA